MADATGDLEMHATTARMHLVILVIGSGAKSRPSMDRARLRSIQRHQEASDTRRPEDGRLVVEGIQGELSVHATVTRADEAGTWARTGFATTSAVHCAETGKAGVATSGALAKAADLFNFSPSPNTRLLKPASVYPGERVCPRAPCLSGIFSMRPNALQPARRVVQRSFVSPPTMCWLYFAPDFSGAGNMEIQQLKSEITALRARFDALRGYL